MTKVAHMIGTVLSYRGYRHVSRCPNTPTAVMFHIRHKSGSCHCFANLKPSKMYLFFNVAHLFFQIFINPFICNHHKMS